MRMLSENFFNIAQFKNHTITASTYQAGNQPWRVGTGRRSDRNAWIAPTTGAQWVRASCDQVRAADTIALDRGHNLSTIAIQYTNSTASGWQTHETITLSTVTYPNSRITDSPGARMPDGAWIYRFATSANLPAAKFWRADCTSTGNPKVVGLYLGRSFAPSHPTLRPWDDQQIDMRRAEVASPELWTAASQVAYRRVGSMTARLTDKEGDQASYHVRDLYQKGELAWITPNEDQAENTILANAPSGVGGMPVTADWTHRVLTIEWAEHQPKLR